MSLIINQGPLPQDGDRVAASTFLEDWINGTEVFGLDANSFSTSLNFVTSQTDAPGVERRGMLWFKRGEGTLYIRERSDRCSTRYLGTENDSWLNLAPTRAFIGEVVTTDALGGACTIGEQVVEILGLSSFYEDCKGRRIAFYAGLLSAFSGIDDTTKVCFHTGIVTNTNGSGVPTPIVEWGFTQGLIASGGSNLARGAFAKLYYIDPQREDYFMHPRMEGWTGETNYGNVAIICETNATTSSHLALIFKRPGLDYAWRMSYS